MNVSMIAMYFESQNFTEFSELIGKEGENTKCKRIVSEIHRRHYDR